jgi:hypothetical protein
VGGPKVNVVLLAGGGTSAGESEDVEDMMNHKGRGKNMRIPGCAFRWTRGVRSEKREDREVRLRGGAESLGFAARTSGLFSTDCGVKQVDPDPRDSFPRKSVIMSLAQDLHGVH